MDLLDLTLQEFLIFVLCLLRMAGIVVFAPFFGGEDFPRRARIGLAALLALVVYPHAAATVQGPLQLDWWTLVVLTAREVFVGVVIGYAASLVFAGAQLAGELIGQQLGFALANVLDPFLEQEVGLISFFKFSFAIVIFLSLDLHLVLLHVLAGSYLAVGLGASVLRPELLEGVWSMFAGIWEAAVRLGGPVLLIMLLVSVVVGVLTRTMPQLNIIVIGLPLRTFVGLLALSMVARPFAEGVATLCRQMIRDVDTVVQLLGPAG